MHSFPRAIFFKGRSHTGIGTVLTGAGEYLGGGFVGFNRYPKPSLTRFDGKPFLGFVVSSWLRLKGFSSLKPPPKNQFTNTYAYYLSLDDSTLCIRRIYLVKFDTSHPLLHSALPFQPNASSQHTSWVLVTSCSSSLSFDKLFSDISCIINFYPSQCFHHNMYFAFILLLLLLLFTYLCV